VDNTVGSLTRVQKSIITGKLLGDGSLRRRKNSLLEVNHSHEQKEYVLWLYEELKPYVLTPPKLRKSGKNRFSYRFTTRSIPELNVFYEDYYSSNKAYKTVPRDLKLNPLILAIWFMDDGSKDRDSVYFNTQQFDLDDQIFLLEKLSEIGLQGSLNKDKTYFRIRLYKRCFERFNTLVEPLVLESMKYKLLL
jgi:hypothetical protein